MRKLTKWFIAIVFVLSFGGALFSIAVPQTASAACEDYLLGFPPWYKGVVDGSCNITVNNPPQPASGTTQTPDLSRFIWTIVSNVVEIALMALIYISVGFIIFGGFYFMTSNGKPDKAAIARRTILDAAIGLAIGISATVIVYFITTSLG